MKKIGQICCFNYLLFESSEPDPISVDKRFIWPDQNHYSSLCLIIENIEPKNVYVQNHLYKNYIQERHKPYLCYFLKEKKCFITIEAELTELK